MSKTRVLRDKAVGINAGENKQIFLSPLGLEDEGYEICFVRPFERKMILGLTPEQVRKNRINQGVRSFRVGNKVFTRIFISKGSASSLKDLLIRVLP